MEDFNRNDKGRQNRLNNGIIVIGTVIVGVGIWILANSNYDEVTAIRDQRNLQATLEDCKRLFGVGEERTECIDKSLNAFGTGHRKQQWNSGHFTP